ncbi:MAG: D-arabinono-1,4-lactone oxidase [Natrialbaceae archaeon]|nr:D-arabinono-1,4-lactone oxidase [Natrialbaceae archaeon]
MPLEEVLEVFPQLAERHRHFEFFWFPHTENALVKVIDRTDSLPDEGGRFDDIGERLANEAWEGMCRLGTKVPFTATAGAKLASATLSGGVDIGPSYEVFANDRDVRFDEMEYGVPFDEAAAAMRSIREVADADSTVQFPIEFRVVAEDDILLSPAHGRDSAFIAVHKYHQKPYRSYFDTCEERFKRFEGRPHWGKLHYRDADDFADLYPEWDTFQSIRTDVDPEGTFMNSHLERVFIE